MVFAGNTKEQRFGPKCKKSKNPWNNLTNTGKNTKRTQKKTLGRRHSMEHELAKTKGNTQTQIHNEGTVNKAQIKLIRAGHTHHSRLKRPKTWRPGNVWKQTAAAQRWESDSAQWLMSAEARAQETASTRIQEWKQGAAAAQKIELGAAAAQSWLVAAA